MGSLVNKYINVFTRKYSALGKKIVAELQVALEDAYVGDMKRIVDGIWTKYDVPEQYQNLLLSGIAGKLRTTNLQKKTAETTPDLYIIEGPTMRLDIKKLEWCISQGMDNEYIRKAIREKEKIDKYEAADAIMKDELEALRNSGNQTSPEYKKYNILRSDDPQTRANKKAQREKIWAEYFRKKGEIQSKNGDAHSRAYGEKFFGDLDADEDATGWEWMLSGGGVGEVHCEICKQNAGIYAKGHGPKFPAHVGCTCLLGPVYRMPESTLRQ